MCVDFSASSVVGSYEQVAGGSVLYVPAVTHFSPRATLSADPTSTVRVHGVGLRFGVSVSRLWLQVPAMDGNVVDCDSQLLHVDDGQSAGRDFSAMSTDVTSGPSGTWLDVYLSRMERVGQYLFCAQFTFPDGVSVDIRVRHLGSNDTNEYLTVASVTGFGPQFTVPNDGARFVLELEGMHLDTMKDLVRHVRLERNVDICSTDEVTANEHVTLPWTAHSMAASEDGHILQVTFDAAAGSHIRGGMYRVCVDSWAGAVSGSYVDVGVDMSLSLRNYSALAVGMSLCRAMFDLNADFLLTRCGVCVCVFGVS